MNKTIAFLVLTLTSLSQVQAAQTCQTSITETAPASEFTVNNDGTVVHDETGLTWMQCSLGQTWTAGDCVGNASSYTWEAALQSAEAEVFAGGNWRLPNIKELRSIVEYACIEPAINISVFPNTPLVIIFYPFAENAWSSSSHSVSSGSAWGLNFGGGNDDSRLKYLTLSVRLVRGQ